MRLLKRYKALKASSLIESVLAITIISICLLVAFLIYLNVIQQNSSVNFYRAKHKVESLTHDMIINRDYADDVFEFKGYSINKVVEINNEAQTATVAFTIKDGAKAHTINKLVVYHEN